MVSTTSGRRGRWQVLLLLALVVSILAGCGAPPPTDVPPTGAGPTATALPPTSSPTPTLTDLPTVVAARPRTATPTPSPTRTVTPRPSATARLTPSLTPSATATATVTRTPGPPTQTVTPTATTTATLAPTLTPTPMYSPTPVPTPAVTGDYMHMLLIGLDSTKNLRGQNTDVIIVVVLNKDTNQVSLLSIPRDLWVYIPTYGWSRINTAHKFGYRPEYEGSGPDLLAETIRINLGISIDHWARVDFQGFARVVDALGGVDMVVPCPVNLRYQAPTSDEEEEMVLEPGVYHMDGSTALRYVRTRRGGSDFDRARRQHQFLRAVWHQTKDQLKGLDFVPRIKDLWTALKGSYETDLNILDVLALAPVALDLQTQRIRSRYIGADETISWTTHDGWEVLLPEQAKIQAVVASLYSAPASAEEGAASESARVQVWNGTGLPQRELIAADQLRWRGVNVVETGPADQATYAKTRIVVFRDRPKTVAILLRELGLKEQSVVYQLDDSQAVDIRVILGADYQTCR